MTLFLTASAQSAAERTVRFSEENMAFLPGSLEDMFPWTIPAETVENAVEENDVQPDEYDDLDFGFEARNIIAEYSLNDSTCSYYNFEFYEGKLIKIKILLQTQDPEGPQPDRDEITRVFEEIKSQFPLEEMTIDDSSQSAIYHKNTYYKAENYMSDKTSLALWGHRATDKSAAVVGIELKDRIFFEGVKEVYVENPAEAYGQFEDESAAKDGGDEAPVQTPTPTPVPTPTPLPAYLSLPEITLDESELPILPSDLLSSFVWNSSEERVLSALNSGKVVPDITTNNRTISAKYTFGDWKLEIDFVFDYSGKGLISMTYTVRPVFSGKQPRQEEIARVVEYFESLFTLSGMSKDLSSNTAQIYGWTCWKADSYKDSSKMLSFFGHRYAGRTDAYFGVYLSSTYYHDSINPVWMPNWEDDAYGQIDYADFDYPDLPDDISDEDQAVFSKSGRMNIPMPFESPTSQPKICFWVDTYDAYTFNVVYPRILTTSFYPITVQFNSANPDTAETLLYNYQIFDFRSSCNGCTSPADDKHGIGVVSGEGQIRLRPGRYCVYLKNSGLQDFDSPPYLTTLPAYSWCQAPGSDCNRYSRY